MAKERNDAGVAANRPETAGSGAALQARMLAPIEPVGESYADGVIGVTLRSGVAKVELYSVVGVEADGKTELRRVSHRLAIPLSALNELAALLRRMSTALAPARAPAGEGLSSPLA